MRIHVKFLIVVLIVASFFGTAMANNGTDIVEEIRRDYSEMKKVDVLLADAFLCNFWFDLFMEIFGDGRFRRFKVAFNTTEFGFKVTHARFVMSSFFMSPYAHPTIKMLYDENDSRVQACLEERITSYVDNMAE